MAEIIQNNIQFTKVQNDNIFAAGGKYSISANDDGTGKYDTSIPGEEITKSFNAVEIDWNGAKPGIGEDATNGITTTGELLSSNKGVYSPMFAN